MVVENGGFGATIAAPIVRKALDFYLLGRTKGTGPGRAVPVSLGVTGLLIAVSVVVETMKQLEAQMLMRNYEGFIK